MPVCQFCNHHPSCVTVTRNAPNQPPATLHLCGRCGYLHQVVAQVAVLEQVMPAPPCLLCAKLSVVTAEVQNKEGQFLGRFRLCQGCMDRDDFSVADILKVATPWTPGILELPPPAVRVFPMPPKPTMPGNN